MLAKRAAFTLVLSALFLVAGCNMVGADSPKSGTLDLAGTVEFAEIEGGHWVITENGESYVPLESLPQGFRTEGLPVRVTGQIRKDVVSICQCGPVVEIKDIERR
jgi:hypothetical protein